MSNHPLPYPSSIDDCCVIRIGSTVLNVLQSWKGWKKWEEVLKGLGASLLQDMVKPAVLYNHDNEYLHYEDDWYILASKPDEYVVVYYRGNNDAWKGYGGAVIYTR